MNVKEQVIYHNVLQELIKKAVYGSSLESNVILLYHNDIGIKSYLLKLAKILSEIGAKRQLQKRQAGQVYLLAFFIFAFSQIHKLVGASRQKPCHFGPSWSEVTVIRLKRCPNSHFGGTLCNVTTSVL